MGEAITIFHEYFGLVWNPPGSGGSTLIRGILDPDLEPRFCFWNPYE